jgi:broad specificity phosphatase PhoE
VHRRLVLKLVRHGESLANVGHVDPQRLGDFRTPLTERGAEQARLAGVRVGAEFLRGALVYHSPYHRTRQTLAALMDGAGARREEALGVYEDPRLREQDHGYSDVAKQHAMRETHGWFYYRYEGGESPADVFDRVSGFLESMMRQVERKSAERVLIVSTGGLQAEAATPPPHAVSTLMRTIDLFVAQPRVGEVQQGELAAIGRRFAEFNVCEERLADVGNTGNIGPFCRRTGPGFVPKEPVALQAATSMWLGAARFDQVASSWRSAWMFRPESTLQTASGYSFSPAVMRPLFQDGVRTFQQRCTEVLRLFEIRGDIAKRECEKSANDAVAEAVAQFAPAGACTNGKPEQRECD